MYSHGRRKYSRKRQGLSQTSSGSHSDDCRTFTFGRDIRGYATTELIDCLRRGLFYLNTMAKCKHKKEFCCECEYGKTKEFHAATKDLVDLTSGKFGYRLIKAFAMVQGRAR